LPSSFKFTSLLIKSQIRENAYRMPRKVIGRQSLTIGNNLIKFY
jgi:hypothetical protein